MRIAQFIPAIAAAHGGPPRAVVEMSAALARRGHGVTVFTTDFGGASVDYSAAARAGVDIRVFPWQWPAIMRRSPAVARAATALAASGQLDLSIVHGPYQHHTLVANALRRRFGVPYIMRPLGAFDPFIRDRNRIRNWAIDAIYHNRVVREAAAFHFTAEDERRLAAPVCGGRPSFVVPLGFDIAERSVPVARGAFRRRHGIAPDEPVALFLGRISRKKGLDLLIPAFRQAIDCLGKAKLVLAGPFDPDMRQLVDRLLSNAGLQSAAIIPGMIVGIQKDEAFADADIFVLPSYTENFGIAIIEALAAGTPVVISDRINIWREIAAAEVGIVTPIETRSLAQAIVRLLSDHSLRRAMAARARPFVVRNYALDVVATRLEAAFCAVVAADRAGRTPAFD